MSFFKRTFKKAKKGVKKAVNKVEKVVDEGTNEVKKAVDKSASKIDKVAEEGFDKLEKGANLAKEGLEETGDFLLNSSDREYWNKEISHLKNRFNNLREELKNKVNAYYDVRIDYQGKVHQFITIKQDTIALGLVSSDKLDLDKVMDNAGIIVDYTREFSESNSEIEEIGRYTLGLVSAGISEIVFASQEAKKEAKHLNKQISLLEENLEKINNNIANHKKGIVLINQSLTEILQLYGEDTTIDNFVSKQCQLIYKQAKELKVHRTIIKMQKKNVAQQEIVEATANI
ncbi:hypothetical protein Riv7116_3249 [Rivularia sp. PCC 7116]|uniref:hypothetical protein n=1 Tax=Rivularia sp. PCC 7116 TaxID=373994 RepID=UPI00029EF933|nr:hypothetical protein [Rivularia sp. PCC 7116]AFY55719.1 hypothetical protein Riv7116_3249 [Rivularia sp. PCC 7116]